MKCIKNPSVPTWLIIYNDQGLLTTAYVGQSDQTCTKETNTIEQFTNEAQYVQRCDELGVDPIIPPSE